LNSIKPSDLSLPDSQQSNIGDKYDQLNRHTKRLRREIQQTKEQLETLNLEKDSEIEELKKQIETIRQQPTASSSPEVPLERKLMHERSENPEKQRIEQQKNKISEERDELRVAIEKLDPLLFEQIKKALPSLFATSETIEDRRKQVEEEQYQYNISVVKEWLSDLLGKDFTLSNLHMELVDGSLLCKVMNIIIPGSIRKYYPSPKITMLRIENIGFFLGACERELGLSPFQLFSASELIDGLNIKKVVIVLIDIMKRVNLKDFN